MGIRINNAVGRTAMLQTGAVASTAARVLGRKALQANRLAIALLGCCSLWTTEAVAEPLVFEDSYVLETMGQNMWSAGAEESWSYDSGLLGKAWGTYSGQGAAPATVPFDLMAGSKGTIIDDRVGVEGTVSSSGRLGINVKAEANGGSVDVTLPVTTALTIDSANGMMTVSGSHDFGAGAVISATAPSFKAGVDGVINIESKVQGLGCLLVGGCKSFDATIPGVDLGQFPLVGFDSTSTKPISILGFGLGLKFGEEYEFRAGAPACQGPVTADGSPPVCPKSPLATPALAVWKASKLEGFDGDTVVGNVLSASNINADGNNQELLSVTADLTGIAQYALGIGVDVLSPKIDLTVPVLGKVGSVSGTLVNLQLGLALGETQRLTFAPTLQATLEFDKPVTQFRLVAVEDFCLTPIGPCFVDPINPTYELQEFGPARNVVAVDLGDSETTFGFAGETPNLLKRTYSIKDSPDTPNFTNNVDLTLDPTMPLKAGCLQLKSAGSLLDTGLQCLFDETFKTTGLFDHNVFSNNFSLTGFNEAEFTATTPGGPGPGPMPGDTGSGPGDTVSVPEPATLWLFAAGIAGLAFSRRRAIGPRPG